MKKFYPILIVIFAALTFSCGQKKIMNFQEMPVPADAKEGTIDGAYEVELDNATNSILSDLKKSYGKTEEKILFLSADGDADKVFEFYAARLAEKGFTKDETVPPANRNYKLNVWRNDGWLGGEAVAVAVIEAGKDAGGKANKFLALYLAEK